MSEQPELEVDEEIEDVGIDPQLALADARIAHFQEKINIARRYHLVLDNKYTTVVVAKITAKPPPIAF